MPSSQHSFPNSSPGPHDLDLDWAGRRAFVACDRVAVVTLDLASGRELAQVPIAGPPAAIWHNHRLDPLCVDISNPGVIDVINTQAMTGTSVRVLGHQPAGVLDV